MFPDHVWLPWLFNQVPKNFWGDMKNQRNFMDWLGKRLNVKKLDDWYKITGKVIIVSNEK